MAGTLLVAAIISAGEAAVIAGLTGGSCIWFDLRVRSWSFSLRGKSVWAGASCRR